MDVQMPEMDGIEATKQIICMNKGHHPVIIAMTASALVADRESCFQAGMNDFISKPIKIDIIEEVILKWFNHIPAIPK
jgi:CheY-like chemotaxis protein